MRRQVPQDVQRNLHERSLVKHEIAQFSLVKADVTWFLSAERDLFCVEPKITEITLVFRVGMVFLSFQQVVKRAKSLVECQSSNV